MHDIPYGFTRSLPGVPFEVARQRIEAALKEEGFGVITEIDVQATFKTKLDVDFRPYTILGACNPKFAHRSLSADLGVGLLLPCNVVVTQDDTGESVISMLDPNAMLEVLPGNPKLEELMVEVRAGLQRALAKA